MMNDKETYGIELKLIVDKFNQKISQTKKSLESLGKKAKENIEVKDFTGDITISKIKQVSKQIGSNFKDMSKGIFGFDKLKVKPDDIEINNPEVELYAKLNKKQLLDELNKVEQEIKIRENAINKLKENNPNPQFQPDTEKLNELRIKYDDLTDALKRYNDEQKDTSNENKNHESDNNKLLSGIDKLSHKFNKLVLSLFSVRSMYSILSRASQSYLSIDKESSTKMQAAWMGLGAVLAPIIEKIADGIIKLVKYINVFAQALTGTNYLANASSKYMNNLSKSASKASKQLAGFDQLTNLSEQTTSSSASANNPFDVFKDVELNETIVKSLQDLAGWLKENWNWIKKVGEVLLIAFAGAKFMGMLSNLQAMSGVLGTSGILGSLSSIAAIAATAIIVTIVIKEVKEYLDTAKEANEEMKEATDNTRKFAKTVNDNTNIIVSSIKDGTATTEAITGAINDVNNSIEKNIGEMENQQKAIDKTDWFTRNFTNNVYNYRQQIIASTEVNQAYVDQLWAIYEATGWDADSINNMSGKIERQIEDLINANKYLDKNSDEYKENQTNIEKLQGRLDTLSKSTIPTEIQKLKEQNSKLKEGSKKWKENNDKIKELEDSMNNIDGMKSKLEIDINTAEAERKSKSFFGKLSDSFQSLGTQFNPIQGIGWKALRNIWKFDEGTNYVPSDNFAIVHKGEAVIPKKFNNKKFFSSGNEETNSLLRELITTLDEKNMNVSLDPNAVGKASVNYINNQSRIMGRSVV